MGPISDAKHGAVAHAQPEAPAQPRDAVPREAAAPGPISGARGDGPGPVSGPATVATPGSASLPKEGDRIQTPDGSIYLILDLKARHITDIDVYGGMFGSSRSWTTLSSLGNIATGPDLNTHNALIQGTDGSPEVYLVDGGQKRWITTWDVFTSYGFDPAQIHKLDLSAYPVGPNIWT